MFGHLGRSIFARKVTYTGVLCLGGIGMYGLDFNLHPTDPQNVKTVPDKFCKEYVYEMNNGPRGLALVINNHRGWKGITSESRKYPDEDRQEKGLKEENRLLCTLFQKLGLDVLGPNGNGFRIESGENTLKTEEGVAIEVEDIFDEFKKKFKIGYHKMAIIAMLGAGGNNPAKPESDKPDPGDDFIFTYTKSGEKTKMKIKEEVLEKFNDRNCPEMAGIPKIFIFGNCRGNKEKVKETYRDEPKEDPNNDMLIIYAADCGFKAYSDGGVVGGVSELVNVCAKRNAQT